MRADASRAMNEPPLRRARHRLPWLLVGLVGSMLASWVMSRFEATLVAITAVAYLIPAIVYLADAVGTQTEAIAVRSLAMADVPLRRCVGGEVRTGAFVGLVLGLVSIPDAWLVAGNLMLAVAVGVSVVIASTLAAAIGLLLPYALARCHIDPAYGSGPLATIIQDVLSLRAYFACVLMLVV